MNATYDFREFQNAAKRVSHAISTDPDPRRDTLRCLHIVGTKHGTKVIAADGFRLAVAKLGPAAGDQTFDIVLNPLTIKALLARKLGKKESPELTFSYLEGSRALVNASIEGCDFGNGTDNGDGWNYPDTSVIIPRESKTSFSVYPLPLMQAIKTARVFAREGSNAVRLHISEDLVISGKSEVTGESLSVVSTYKRVGPELLIAFNADFLVDCLKQAGTEAVKFEFNKPTTPALITFHDGTQCVIMPMNFGSEPLMHAEDIPAPVDAPAGESFIWEPSTATPDSSWLYDRLAGKHAPIDYTGDDYVNRPNQWVISDDIFTSTPEPGVVEYDLTGATWGQETPKYGKPVPYIELELSNPRPLPVPEIPEPAELPRAEVEPEPMVVEATPDPLPQQDPEPDEVGIDWEQTNKTLQTWWAEPPAPAPLPSRFEIEQDPDPELIPAPAVFVRPSRYALLDDD